MAREFDSSGAVISVLIMVGEILAAEGETVAIVIIGGAALLMSEQIQRGTTDVDIVAMGFGEGPNRVVRPPSEPLPAPLLRAARLVAREQRLDEEWLNAVSGSLWRTGPPPGMDSRIAWARYGGLEVGIVGRQDLIFLKLDAAIGATGPRDKHFRDLLALRPTPDELHSAAGWVGMQDAGAEHATQLARMVENVQRALGQIAR